jgi:hypothetical protein
MIFWSQNKHFYWSHCSLSQRCARHQSGLTRSRAPHQSSPGGSFSASLSSWTAPLCIGHWHTCAYCHWKTSSSSSRSLCLTIVITKRRPSPVYMESSAPIPRGMCDCSVESHTASYLNDSSYFTVATDIDYVSMAHHCYGHSSDGNCVRQ